jgi:hypothetical protein
MWVKQTIPAVEKFVGAFQDHSDPTYAEPNRGWKWLTGEPFALSTFMTIDDCPGGTKGSCGCVGDGNQDVLVYTGCCNNQLDDIGDGIVSGCDSINRQGIIEWSADCNNDGLVDYGQILSGQLADTDQNGVPDSCEVGPCPGDVTGNNTVDGIDLAALLAAWGGGKSQFDCDIDNDGIVGGSDLAIVLAGWGACP